MIVEAAFMGGPLDGMLRAFPGDEPPRDVVVSVPPGPLSLSDPLGEVIPDVRFLYERRVSQMDDGPLWVYVPAEVTA